ncbi:MAG: 50S ribosomal protein L29 [Candidatus Levybacteria bacterium RIFCSPLOWO2_01_FULL_38_13]|nr:MAG: 50S ribosomal protein L29 [Candidatus Levybacteria bacterium RIFCSPHIGHO2_01_FULL_41_15]OGH34771.1 MAG: 50S ribosomal protein L29 [Candidatus Levybacteria bacterium RIFCSPLOWO2_01_FULL_38_13]
MKTKQKKELFLKTKEELKALLKDARNDLFNLRQDLFQKKLKNLRAVFLKRKEIAQILTALREKELSYGQKGVLENEENI